MKDIGVNLRYILISVLLIVILFTGCKQTAFINNNQTQTNGEAGVQSAKVDNSPSPVSRLTEILDGKKYTGKFTIRVFNLIQKDSNGKTSTGDILLLQSPDGLNMLIDTGHKETVSNVIENIKKLGIIKLDYVVLTHMHGDHVDGFPAVMNAFPVDKVISSRHATRNVGAAKSFMSTLNEKGMKYEVIKEGDTFQFGKDIKVEVLNPVDDNFEIPDTEYANGNQINNESIVLKMTYGSKTFLFAGDIQMETEFRLVEKYGESIDVDLIKVPHHGYNTSSSGPFLRAVTPAIALMPQCDNPLVDIDKRYKSVNSALYVTGLDGILLAVSDGKSINVVTEKEWKVNSK